ncbi:MAG: hypothetical protein ACK56I_21265, partial [bacterium]
VRQAARRRAAARGGSRPLLAHGRGLRRVRAGGGGRQPGAAFADHGHRRRRAGGADSPAHRHPQGPHVVRPGHG